jgi:hypothetical protein
MGSMSMNRLIVSIVICEGLCLSLPRAGQAADSGDDILAATGSKGGLVVHVGCADGKLIAALGAGDGCVVQGLDRNLHFRQTERLTD